MLCYEFPTWSRAPETTVKILKKREGLSKSATDYDRVKNMRDESEIVRKFVVAVA